MDHPASVTAEERAEIERERALLEGETPATEPPNPTPPPAPAPPSPPPTADPVPAEEECRIQFSAGGQLSILDLLKVYEIGKSYIPKKFHERWQLTYALAWSTGGIYVGTKNDDVKTLVIFWRTDNPNVNPDLGVPVPAKNGNFIYVCWMWNELGIETMRKLREYFDDVCDGAKFVAHHDQRKGRQRNHLITVPLQSMTEGVL